MNIRKRMYEKNLTCKNIKIIEYLGINQTKEVEELYAENDDTDERN